MAEDPVAQSDIRAVDAHGEDPSKDRKIKPRWLVLIAVCMFGSALWAGGEIAKGEIAQQQLDSITAKGRLVKAKVSVPADVVLEPSMVEEIDAFANRVEPYCVTSATTAVGKKTKYGLEAGQVLVIKDLQ